MSQTPASELHQQAQTKLDRCRAIAARSSEGRPDPWATKTPQHDRMLRQMHAAEGILAALLAIDARLAALTSDQPGTD